MTKWKNEPFSMNVTAGDIKAFCMCGLSDNAPFCDGAHVTTDKKPHVEKFTEDKTIYICGCRESSKSPYCDGTHKTLSETQ